MARVPDLVMAQVSASPNPARVGEELTLTVDVPNPGLAGEATGVQATLPLAGLEFVLADPAQGTCSESDGMLVCEVGALAEGESAPVEVTVIPSEPVIRTDEASVSADGDDPYPRNNSGSVTTVVADAGCGNVLTEDTVLEEDIGPVRVTGWSWAPTASPLISTATSSSAGVAMRGLRCPTTRLLASLRRRGWSRSTPAGRPACWSPTTTTSPFMGRAQCLGSPLGWWSLRAPPETPSKG